MVAVPENPGADTLPAGVNVAVPLVPAGVNVAVPFVPAGVYGLGPVRLVAAPVDLPCVVHVCGVPVKVSAGTVPAVPVKVSAGTVPTAPVKVGAETEPAGVYPVLPPTVPTFPAAVVVASRYRPA